MNTSGKLETGVPTVCVVNYKTELLTKLCLRSIRKFTPQPYKLIAVDNDSRDESLEYLRSLKWITLVERGSEVCKSGSWAHGSGLDAGLDATDTEFFVAMHSDTFVHREGWLDMLLKPALANPAMACVGGGKLDLKPRWLMLLKSCTDVKEWLRRIRPGGKRRDFYVRTICALYRTEALRRESLRFAMDTESGMTCGQQLYYGLLAKGHTCKPLPETQVASFIHHLAHATMALNPEFTVRRRTEAKCRKRLEAVLNSPLAQEILNDKSLDQ